MKQLDLQLTAGNNKRNRRELDFYPTPPEATIALMDFLKLEKQTIWECACGNNAMSDVLESYGHNVISTDINSGIDFLKAHRECDAIITNPPFNVSAEFIQKATKEADVVAFLLKSQYWHAKKRSSLFDELPPSYVLPLTWRPDFLYQERKEGEKKGSPTMEVAWSVWIKGDKNTKYKPLLKPVM
jgi:predicted RNA methylase